MRFLPKRGLYDSGRVLYLPVDQISPNPSQPRSVFSQEELEELADSIQNLGVLQPLTVRRQEGRWELVAGERRLRAAPLPLCPGGRAVLRPAGPGGKPPAAGPGLLGGGHRPADLSGHLPPLSGGGGPPDRQESVRRGQ